MEKEVCRSKLRYYTRKKAWDASLYFFKKIGQYGTPYNCKVCKKYHLSVKHAQWEPSKEFVKEFEKWFGLPVLTDKKYLNSKPPVISRGL